MGSLLNKQMNKELEEKIKIIEKLSSEVKKHEVHFKELKEELKQAKDRQVAQEDVYEECFLQIEQLLPKSSSNSDIGMDFYLKKNFAKKTTGMKKMDPTIVTENVKRMIATNKKNLKNLNDEVKSLKSANDELTTECKEIK